jgi:hypothetical protein
MASGWSAGTGRAAGSGRSAGTGRTTGSLDGFRPDPAGSVERTPVYVRGFDRSSQIRPKPTLGQIYGRNTKRDPALPLSFSPPSGSPCHHYLPNHRTDLTVLITIFGFFLGLDCVCLFCICFWFGVNV